MQYLIKTALFIYLITLLSIVQATENEDLSNIIKQLEKNIPSLKVEAINESPMPGVYEILAGGQILYVSADAKFLISGKLFSIDKGIVNLTDEAMRQLDMKLSPMRRDEISAINESDMVIFKATEEKYKITVFTDVDCAYCRRLHKEMPEYHKLGITVRYLGYPRAGLGSSSHVKLESIWCSKDRNAAMNKAKLDRTFGADSCETPLAEHFKLVRKFKINGTPAVILKSGQYISGFVPAKQLLKIILEDEAALEKLEAKAG